jgi:hypothetical protein
MMREKEKQLVVSEVRRSSALPTLRFGRESFISMPNRDIF